MTITGGGEGPEQKINVFVSGKVEAEKRIVCMGRSVPEGRSGNREREPRRLRSLIWLGGVG